MNGQDASKRDHHDAQIVDQRKRKDVARSSRMKSTAGRCDGRGHSCTHNTVYHRYLLNPVSTR